MAGQRLTATEDLSVRAWRVLLGRNGLRSTAVVTGDI